MVNYANTLEAFFVIEEFSRQEYFAFEVRSVHRNYVRVLFISLFLHIARRLIFGIYKKAEA